MEVIVDGCIFSHQKQGGISRIYHEIFPKMCELDKDLSLTVISKDQLNQEIPMHKQVKAYVAPDYILFLRPNRLWLGFIKYLKNKWVAKKAGSGTGKIWHSTYYTLPESWSGKMIVTVYDMIHEKYPNYFTSKNCDHVRKIKRESIERADAVICISQTTKDDILAFYNVESSKLHVVPLAPSKIFKVVDEIENKVNQYCNGRKFLLYVGGRVNYKNTDLLFKAYASWEQRKNVSLLCVGGKFSEAELSFFKELGIEQDVFCVQNVTDEELCVLYNKAELFVYPSLYEGFGIPLLEAMACGCPVVASRIPSTEEVAGDNAFYFDADNINSLCLALDQALVPEERERKIQLGIERVKNYSWEKTAQMTLEIYRRINS